MYSNHFSPGMLVYRVFRNERKRKLKLAHAGLNFVRYCLNIEIYFKNLKMRILCSSASCCPPLV